MLRIESGVVVCSVSHSFGGSQQGGFCPCFGGVDGHIGDSGGYGAKEFTGRIIIFIYAHGLVEELAGFGTAAGGVQHFCGAQKPKSRVGNDWIVSGGSFP